jgi:hypothetical protein
MELDGGILTEIPGHQRYRPRRPSPKCQSTGGFAPVLQQVSRPSKNRKLLWRHSVRSHRDPSIPINAGPPRKPARPMLAAFNPRRPASWRLWKRADGLHWRHPRLAHWRNWSCAVPMRRAWSTGNASACRRRAASPECCDGGEPAEPNRPQTKPAGTVVVKTYTPR